MTNARQMPGGLRAWGRLELTEPKPLKSEIGFFEVFSEWYMPYRLFSLCLKGSVFR